MKAWNEKRDKLMKKEQAHRDAKDREMEGYVTRDNDCFYAIMSLSLRSYWPNNSCLCV